MTDILKKAHPVDTAKEGDEVIICVNQTPFYGESGGQVGDTGVMGWTDGSAVVTNTSETAGLVLHHVRIHTESDGDASVQTKLVAWMLPPMPWWRSSVQPASKPMSW